MVSQMVGGWVQSLLHSLAISLFFPPWIPPSSLSAYLAPSLAPSPPRSLSLYLSSAYLPACLPACLGRDDLVTKEMMEEHRSQRQSVTEIRAAGFVRSGRHLPHLPPAVPRHFPWC